MRAFIPVALAIAFACISDGCGGCETTAAPAASAETGAVAPGAGSVLADGVAADGSESCTGCPMEAAAKAACAEEKSCSEEKSCCPSEAKPAATESSPSR